MRLWHEALIPTLSDQRLLGQHSEICGMRGLHWGIKHSIVDYVFTYAYGDLVFFHFSVMREMEKRGMNVNQIWWYPNYRGQKIGFAPFTSLPRGKNADRELTQYIYPEHDDVYLAYCKQLLQERGDYKLKGAKNEHV